MSEINKRSKQSQKPKPAPDEPAAPNDESRVKVGSNPFTLHIDDTPENVARALFGKPLKRE